MFLTHGHAAPFQDAVVRVQEANAIRESHERRGVPQHHQNSRFVSFQDLSQDIFI